jgi:hypothetical protein
MKLMVQDIPNLKHMVEDGFLKSTLCIYIEDENLFLRNEKWYDASSFLFVRFKTDEDQELIDDFLPF